ALYQQDYATAATQAQEVIANGGYALYPNYRTLFTHAGENNEEVIFSAGYLTNVKDLGLVQLLGPRRSGGDGWSILIPTRDLADSYETVNGLPIDEDPAFDPLNPYMNRDPRLNASIFTNGNIDPVFDPGFTYYVNPDSTNYADVTSAAASYSGFVWKKYVDATGLVDRINVGLDIIQIRLAEMYLIVAEANIENPAGDLTAARNALNEVRARAYGVAASETDAYPAVTTDNRDELRRILRRERKVELAGEGLRLIDIRRWEIAEDVLPGKIYGRALSIDAWNNNFQVPMIDDATGHVVYADESGFEKAMGAGTRSFNPATDYFWMIPLSEVDANDQID
uniref:RagB/SusD family nutrient uptake outer membrane protein n=1 Tax=Persicitalea sp. TaxID=3100273 RepID=UPI003593A1C3